MYAESKKYSVERVFRDSASGGGDFMKRPAMAELLRYADKNAHNEYVVIFDDLSRFARDVVFHFKLRSEFDKRNISRECLNFNFDDSPEGELIETILASQHQYHRKNNNRQVLQKTKARLEKGYWAFRALPGYTSHDDPLHGKILKATEPNASIIKEALQGYASGRFPRVTDVRTFLQSKRYCPDPRKKYRGVSHDLAKRLLCQIVYAGFIEYPKWDVSRRKAHHEGLISIEEYEQIQLRLKKKIKPLTRKDYRADFPLRGCVACALCKRNLTASWSTGRSEKYPYYRCHNKSCPMYGKGINGRRLESDFNHLLMRIKPNQKILKMAEVIMKDVWGSYWNDAETHQKTLKRELSNIDNERKIIIERLTSTSKSEVINAYEEKLVSLSEEERRIQTEIATFGNRSINFGTALEDVFTILKQPYIYWAKGNLHEKRLVLDLVFSDSPTFHPQLGFGTENLSLVIRLFELLEHKNPQYVEMAGIEPASENGRRDASTVRSSPYDLNANPER